MKTFGSHAQKARREQFQLLYMDAQEQERSFEGQLVVRMSGGDLARITSLAKNEDQESVSATVRLLGKMMDDKDGAVPLRWEPKQLDPPADLDDDERDEWEPTYRGPDGVLYPFSDDVAMAKWDDRANWTTRRRWVDLMEKDEDAVVELEDLMALAEWAVGLASERPTRPRA